MQKREGALTNWAKHTTIRRQEGAIEEGLRSGEHLCWETGDSPREGDMQAGREVSLGSWMCRGVVLWIEKQLWLKQREMRMERPCVRSGHGSVGSSL